MFLAVALTLLNTMRAAHPEVGLVIEDAVKKSGERNLEELLKKVKPCPAGAFGAGHVQPTLHHSTRILIRPLVDKIAWPDANAPWLKKFKSAFQADIERNQREMRAELPALPVTVKVEDDLVVLTQMGETRPICVKSDMPPQVQAEVLVHEFVHFANLRSEALKDDPLNFADAAAYANDRIQSEGHEVDAYEFVDRVFHPEKPVLSRDERARMILEKLGYQKVLAGQYRQLLESSLRAETLERQVLKSLYGRRKSEVEELARVFGPTELRKLVETEVMASHRRVTERLRLNTARIGDLKKRLATRT
jgi:hypothetical protein